MQAQNVALVDLMVIRGMEAQLLHAYYDNHDRMPIDVGMVGAISQMTERAWEFRSHKLRENFLQLQPRRHAHDVGRKIPDDRRMGMLGVVALRCLIVGVIHQEYVSIAKNNAELMIKIAQQFGFTPGSRGRTWMIAGAPDSDLLELDENGLAPLGG